MMDKRNSEGYPDPTAAEALANVAREEKAKSWKPCVFICSPFAGDIAKNKLLARRYMKFAVAQGAIPLAPHLLYPQVLDESDQEQRRQGLFFGMIWLGKCDELWAFGDTVSSGMALELAKAKKRRILIRYFTENCEEVERL